MRPRSCHWLVLAWLALMPMASGAQDADGERSDDDTPPTVETIPVGEEQPPALPAAPDDDVATFDEFVVTATRDTDTLSATPISVTVTPEAELRRTNITDLEALSDRLPNAQLALTPTNTFFFVRGLGTGAVRSAEQSVGFFVDGVFLGRPQVALFDFLDVSQVELLRGPQGAILGKNTVAGAVNVQTAEPTWQATGYVEALAGSDDARRGRGAIAGPITDRLAGRVAYSQTEEDGFLFNTTQQRVDLARPGEGGRAKLLWEPTDLVALGLSVQTARIRQIGDSFELSQASDETLAIYRRYDPATSTDITDNRTHTDHTDSGAIIEGEDVILDGDWDAGFGRLRMIAAVSRQTNVADFDLDISPAPFLNFPSREDYRQHSVELRFDDEFGWGDISVGAYYFHADLDLDVDITVFEDGGDAFLAPLIDANTGLPIGTMLTGLLGDLGSALTAAGLDNPADLGKGSSQHRLFQTTRTLSGFGSVRWRLTERWTVRIDGRLTRETKSGDQSLTFVNPTGRLLGAALSEEEYELVDTRRETNFSPRVSLLAQITPIISSYATVARGFKSGGFNNLAAVPERAQFDAESSLTYEAGVRLVSFFGISGELGAFYTTFDNLQVSALDGTELFTGNAAEAYSRGVELAARWDGPLGVHLAADVGYLDAEYVEYTNAPAQADSDDPSQNLSGQTLQRAPEFSGSLSARWLAKLPWVGLPFAIGAVAEGSSHQFLNIDLDPIDSQPGYVRYNAFAGVSNTTGRLSLRLIGRNLTDETVRREAADIAIVGAHSVGVFPPRSLAAELGYRF